MTIVAYPAIMEPAQEGFGVWFPDLPGCVSYGESEADARQQSIEALAFHLEGMAEDGEAFPRPSSINVMADRGEDVAEGGYVFVVTTEAPAPRAPQVQRVNVTFPEALLQRIDVVAAGNRSGWLAEAARQRLIRDGDPARAARIRRLGEQAYPKG